MHATCACSMPAHMTMQGACRAHAMRTTVLHACVHVCVRVRVRVRVRVCVRACAARARGVLSSGSGTCAPSRSSRAEAARRLCFACCSSASRRPSSTSQLERACRSRGIAAKRAHAAARIDGSSIAGRSALGRGSSTVNACSHSCSLSGGGAPSATSPPSPPSPPPPLPPPVLPPAAPAVAVAPATTAAVPPPLSAAAAAEASRSRSAGKVSSRRSANSSDADCQAWGWGWG